MARGIIKEFITQPGYFGLNTQETYGAIDKRFCLKATNLVYNTEGELKSRESLDELISASLTGLTTIHEYIDSSANTLTIYSNKNVLVKESAGSTTDISGATTPREWKFVNFNGVCVGHHPSYAPISLSTVGGTFAAAAGTQYNGADVLSSNGRIWIIDGNTLRYTDLLVNSFAGGSSGSFDLANYWPNGMDEGVALAEWNDFLIVFGKKSIIIYENPDDPTNSMAIADTITGIGCIARDTVKSVGKDLYFLSMSGLRSLGRTIQEKSSPIGNLSLNVHKSVQYDITEELLNGERFIGVYSQRHSFYLLSSSRGFTYIFDISRPFSNGSLRVTTWDMSISGAVELTDASFVVSKQVGHVCTVATYANYNEIMTP